MQISLPHYASKADIIVIAWEITNMVPLYEINSTMYLGAGGNSTILPNDRVCFMGGYIVHATEGTQYMPRKLFEEEFHKVKSILSSTPNIPVEVMNT